jgi:lipoprotein-releasing system permease protein
MADITVSNPYGKRQAEVYPINDTEQLRNIIISTGNIAHTVRYALRSGVIRGEKGSMGILLKGIDSEADTKLFAERLTEGAMPRMEEARRKELILSKTLATKIGASHNDRIEIILLEEDTPRREVFKVCGVYRSALGDTGAELALTDIRNVQKLNNWDSTQISGYACRLHNSELSLFTSELMNLRLLFEYKGEEHLTVECSREQHADIFDWLETHNINAAVITVIMLIVAIFNMVTAMLILVLERTRMVGVLKSMGMQNRTIRRIFAHRALRIIAKGLVIGDVLALVLLLAQKYFHLIKLDEDGYFLSEIPVSLGAGWIVVTNIVFGVIILAATHLATLIVGRIKVAEAIKYS